MISIGLPQYERSRQDIAGALGLASVGVVLFGMPIIYRQISIHFGVDPKVGTMPSAVFNASIALVAPAIIFLAKRWELSLLIRASILLFSAAIGGALATNEFWFALAAFSIAGASAGVFSASTYAAASGRSSRSVSWLVLGSLAANVVCVPYIAVFLTNPSALMQCLSAALALALISFAVTPSKFPGGLFVASALSARSVGSLLGATFFKTLAAYLIYPILGTATFYARASVAIPLEIYAIAGACGAAGMIISAPRSWHRFGAITLVTAASGMLLLGSFPSSVVAFVGVALWGWAGWAYLVPSRIGIATSTGAFDKVALALNTSLTSLAAAVGVAVSPTLEQLAGFQSLCYAGASASIVALTFWHIGARVGIGASNKV